MKQRSIIFLALLGVGLVGLALLWIPVSPDKQTTNLASTTVPSDSAGQQNAPRVLITTNQGDIIVALDAEHAPKTVANFLNYIDEGAYANTIFHRVIKGFMIQGGGFNSDYSKQPSHVPIKNEADNGLKNQRGTIAMARTSDPHSATMQFFINVVDNSFLDHKNPTMKGWGYTVFGHVVEGMDIVDKISLLPTGRGGPFSRDVPKEMVVINNISVSQAP